MKYCVKCGNLMADDMMFCQKCGTKVGTPTKTPDSPANRQIPIGKAATPKEKPRTGMIVFAIICFTFAALFTIFAISIDIAILSLVALFAIIGIMFFALSKSPKGQKNMGKTNGKGIKKSVFVLICVVVAFVAFGIIMGNTVAPSASDPSISNTPASTYKPTPSINLENISDDKEPEPEPESEPEPEPAPLFSDVISDEALRLDFLYACEQIGIAPDKIKGLIQVDDWVSGPRYSFTYSDMAFRLYCNMNSTVNTIKLGADTDIYKQGFEPYQVSDYIVDFSTSAVLRVTTKDYVKGQLNYPATAEFPWFDWTFSRERALYSVSSHVTAKNAFGVEDELPFTLIYSVSDGTATLVYFELDGATVLNNLDSISTPERKAVEVTDSNTEAEDDGSIVLVYGQLGDYGKTVTIDGSDYINYHIPEGTYTITNNGKWCKVYLAKDEYYKNSDGYMENEIVETVEFSNYGETKTVTIGSGEHLELTISASVTLSPTE